MYSIGASILKSMSLLQKERLLKKNNKSEVSFSKEKLTSCDKLVHLPVLLK